MRVELAEDDRQRAADVVALMMLTEHALQAADADLTRLGAMVSTYCAKESPEALHKYSEMEWQQAVRAIKVAFAKHYLASRQADPNELPPPAVDEQIGKCLIAAFLKFATFRSMIPDWYASHLDQMRLGETPAPAARL